MRLIKIMLGSFLAAASAGGAKEGPRVWAVNDGEKVNRDALDHPAQARNSMWDGATVRLFGARNESVAFQVIVPAPDGPLTVKAVTLVFPSSGIGTEIFSEHYLLVAKPTPDDEQGGWFWYKAAAPKGCTGWVPDALVPLTAKPGRGGLPLTIPRGTLQGFWVDVAIPRAGVAAGAHHGTLTLRTSRGDRALPVVLDVLDATLPDADVVKTMVYLSDVERRHGRKDPALVAAYRRMAHRHRFDTAESVGFEEYDAYKPFLTGEAFTPAKGYTGPGEGLGLKVFGVGFYGAVGKETKEELWSTFDRDAAWLKANAPGTLPFIYLTDEPGKDMIAWCKERGDWIHANPGPGGKLSVFVTTKPRPELEGAIDIYATVADNVYLDQLLRERAKGRRWWFYNGMRPMSGAVTLDAPAVDYRVQPWICWKHGVELWFYWESTHWRHNHQGPRARQDQNVWTDPVTFESAHARVNGDGTLFYPGEDAKFPEQDRGIPGPLSSIRMKNLRRGQQDVAYLELARAAGHEAEARAIASGLLPRAFSDAKPHEDVSWPQAGDPWDAARRELADLITGRTNR